MVAHNYSNTASTAVLDSPLNSSSGTFNVTGFTGYPSAPFFILMDRDTSSAELMEVTQVSGSTLTVTRGAGGTAATAHSAGATVEHVIPAAVPQAVEQHVEATSNVHGVTGALVGAANEGTLTNKTYRGAHRHVFTDTLPAAPQAGFLVEADSSTSRDGFVHSGTGANPDRRGFMVTQSGAERFEVYNDGTVRVNPSGVSTRPALDALGTVRATDVEVTDDLTVAGDASVTGTVTAAGVNTGNATVSGAFTSNGANALGTVTAAGLITANAGLEVIGATTTGQLDVTNGNLVLSGSNARLQFPSSPTSSSSGTATGQVRYRLGGIEAWDGSKWRAIGPPIAWTDRPGTGGHVSSSSARIHFQEFAGFGPGIPYTLTVAGQCEINNTSSGARFDLLAVLGPSSTDFDQTFAVGLGPGFTQTGMATSEEITGATTVHWVVARTVGSSGASCDVTDFNQQFTVLALPA